MTNLNARFGSLKVKWTRRGEKGQLFRRSQRHARSVRTPRQQRAAADRQRRRRMGAGDHAARSIRRRRNVGACVALQQPPLRRSRTDGGVGIGRLGAGDRRRARARQFLLAPRDDGQVIVAGFLSFLNPVHWAKSLSGDALHEVVSWVQAGAKAAIGEVAHVIGETTTPQLTSTWFSAAYWRVAGLATLLTVPFLFAAALQAMIRSDLALLARAVFGYLPLALIGVGIAAPITMLLLSATDEMSNLVSGLAVGGASHFLTQAAEKFGLTGGGLFLEVAAAMIDAAG